MTSKKGFTLIELLVVVAIIGLLATLSIISLNTARAKARDARRVGDVKQIQTALELYYNEYSAYPATGALNSASMTPFMSKIPVAPTPADTSVCTNANTYAYTQTGTNGSSYTLTYCLGASTGGLAAGIGTATPAGIKQ